MLMAGVGALLPFSAEGGGDDAVTAYFNKLYNNSGFPGGREDLEFFTRSPRTSLNTHSYQENGLLTGVHREILFEINLGVKVKVNVKVKFTLKQTTKAQKGSRRISPLFL
jgi:hypothetical protein